MDTTIVSPLADLLFKEYRRKVLALLLMHPDQSYHVREVARLTHTVPGTLHRELSQLANAGILTKDVKGNQVSYQANRQCIIFDELASILRKTAGVADVLAQSLELLASQIEVAVVYGSMASGRATSGSDIDLLIVGNASLSAVVNALHSAESALHREINPKVMTRAEWEKAKEQNVLFVRELMERPTLNVIGDRDGFGKSSGKDAGNYRVGSTNNTKAAGSGGTKYQ